MSKEVNVQFLIGDGLEKPFEEQVCNPARWFQKPIYQYKLYDGAKKITGTDGDYIFYRLDGDDIFLFWVESKCRNTKPPSTQEHLYRRVSGLLNSGATAPNGFKSEKVHFVVVVVEHTSTAYEEEDNKSYVAEVFNGWNQKVREVYYNGAKRTDYEGLHLDAFCVKWCKEQWNYDFPMEMEMNRYE